MRRGGPTTTKRAPPKPRTIPRRATSPAEDDDTHRSILIAAFRADPKLAPIIQTFEESAKEKRGRKFGSNGLKVNGKLFALFTQGTLVVKLRKERVAALVAEGVGRPFDPGHGRLMKEWLTIENPRASWLDLAREAHDFVKGAKR
jgi:hypothetical protein